MGARPRYRELPDGSAWGVFGADDTLGCLNLLTAGADGRRGSAGQNRSALQHERAARLALAEFPGPDRDAPGSRARRDGRSRADAMNTSTASTRRPGRSSTGSCTSSKPTAASATTPTPGEVGIEAFAKRGIAGRAVLLDVERWAAAQRDPIDWQQRAIGAADLEACAAWQPSSIAGRHDPAACGSAGRADGRAASVAVRAAAVARGRPVSPGLEPSPAMAESLWDWGIAMIGFRQAGRRGVPGRGLLPPCRPARASLGVPLAEFLWLSDALAAECARQRRLRVPLHLRAAVHTRGGVGSTANALALLRKAVVRA